MKQLFEDNEIIAIDKGSPGHWETIYTNEHVHDLYNKLETTPRLERMIKGDLSIWFRKK
jgi:hypothetical protein